MMKEHFFEIAGSGEPIGAPDSVIKRDLLEISKYYEQKLIRAEKYQVAFNLRSLQRNIEKNKEFTPQKVLEFLSRITQYDKPNSFSASPFFRTSHNPDGYAEIQERMGYFEHKLSELKSNPDLEKKILALEKKLRELQVEEVKGKEKEKRDMLKEYTEAEKKVFVIMPFASNFDDVWKGGIERACEKEGLGYLRVDKISLSSWITKDIIGYIDMADFVISDITGNNPNVMFEFGWALALNKKPIVIRQQNDPKTLPFDVKDIRHIQYINSWSGIEKLSKDLCAFLKSTLNVTEKGINKKVKRKPKK